MNPLKKLLEQTAIYGLSSVVGRLLNYLLVPLYTRYFLPEEYGVVTELYAYVAFLIVFLTYGFETAFFRFIDKNNNLSRVFSTAFLSLLLSSTIFVIISFFYRSNLSELIGYESHTNYIVFFIFILFLDVVSSLVFAKLRFLNKAKKFALIRLTGIFLNISLNLFFIVVLPYVIDNKLLFCSELSVIYFPDFGVGYIFIANLISSLVSFLLLTSEIINISWEFNFKLWKKMFFYSSPLLIAGLAGMTNETIDRILLKNLLPQEVNSLFEVGLYGAFYKLSILMILFIQTFRYAAEPFFFQNKNNPSKQVYADVMKYFVIVTAFVFLIVTTFYDFFIGFLGENYHDPRGFYVVSILLLANFFLGIYYNLSIWYKLTDRTIFGAYISIFGALITLTLNYILIPYYGFLACAVTTFCCYFLMSFISFIFLRQYFPIPYNLKRIAFYFALMIFIFFIVYFDSFGPYIHCLYLLIFLSVVYLIEQPKKSLI